MTTRLNKKETNHKSVNILLVENNDADIKITLRAFNKAKSKNNIYVVEDGQKVLDFVYHKGEYQDEEKFPRPDLILLDIKLPNLDGFQVLEKIKSDTQYNFIPVIMLTTSKHEEDIAKSYRNGASGFIQKPVNYENFIKMIDGFNFYWQIVNKLPGDKYKFER